MSSLDWLSVSGIRSFDHTGEPQIIKFFKPLTIILGANGSGKTTLIECLKCATTGELPPNCDRGKSFVHDPKVSGDTEVKGQIRLQFKAANKKKYITVRSFQVTQKKKTTQFKQLESVLSTKGEDGETKSSSYKCTDMDKLIPELMGVSKAILENVIFCHQEDVNWPLSESTVLKKKLDDIFSSTRYSKALEAIKKTKKDITQQLAEHEKDLAVAETERNQSVKLRKEAENEVIKLQKLKEKIEDLDEKLNQVNTEIEKYEGVIQKVNALKQKLTSADTKKKMMEKDVEEMYQNLQQEFTETDEEVKKYEENFSKQLEQLKQSQRQTENDLARNESNKNSLNIQMNSLKENMGKLKSQKEAHEGRIHDISTDIMVLSQRYRIPGYEQLPFSESQIFSFLTSLDQLFQKEKKELENMRREHKSEQESLLKETNSFLQQKENSTSKLKAATQRKTILENEAKKLSESIRNISITEDVVAEMEREYLVFEKQVRDKEENKEMDTIKKEMDSNAKSQKEQTLKISNLNKELASREKEKDISFKIQNLREELSKHNSSLNDKFSEVRTKYEKTLGSVDNEVTAANIEVKIKGLIKKATDRVQTLTSSLQSLEKSLSVQKSKLDAANNQAQKIKNEIEKKQQHVAAVIPTGKSWDEAMKEAEEKVNDLRNEASMAEALKLCYENFILHARKHKQCFVCERELHTEEECFNFESLQQSKMELTPKLLKKTKEKLESESSVLEKLREIKPIVADIERLKNSDLPQSEMEASNIKQEITNLNEKIEKLTDDINQAKNDEKKTSELLNGCGELKILQTSIKTTQQRITEQENALKSLGLPQDLVPYEQVKNQLEEAQSSREKLTQRQSQLQQELTRCQNELSQMKDKLREKHTILQKSQYDLKELKRLQDSLSEKQAEINQKVQEIEKINLEIPTFEEKYQSHSKMLSEMKERHGKQEFILEGTISDYQQDISKLNVSIQELKKFKDRGVEESLQNVESQITKLDIQIQENQRENERLSELLKKYNRGLEKQNVIKQNIEDNLRYRQKKKELSTITSECETLTKQIENITGSDASLDSYEDIKQLKEKQTRYSNEKSQISGMRSTMKGRVKDIQEQLNSDQYKDIENKYKSLLIKVVTTKHAVEDLDKYMKALEKALTKYHSMKMAEINEIIKELWQKTYRGNDIDTISIKCDTETESARKTYNYRVVMVKGDVELPMRGRSSAGQKVLACLIIRLALAEAFSIDCGILALDEPTNALDIDNANSLAESLRFLIEDRRKLSNFQLIVITHDEEFVRKLGRSELAEHYYRISKDPRTGSSMIEQQKIVD
ncbi:hypothetical protein FDP41_001171 [Naegleria fowleri]|uniref:DNA repair protein RAD50 n=1 Tax=Naegleria fowleri TaxID=5763 RepID=A0A6A5C2A1_NAEFO|nr:uncharacterized protein FDP41_001171 [Naegleria fowleri]KAF0980018.1 hypothetical protein FDP41_001171 [Naegleria fowleri]